VRARSTECAGAVALAVGREAFAPFLARLLGLAFDGMKLGEFELRESTYNFFGLVAHTFGEHFAPAVSDVVACMLATCRSDDGVVLHAKEDAFGRTRDPAQQGAGAFEPDKMTARFARHLRPPSVRPALARLLFFFPVRSSCGGGGGWRCADSASGPEHWTRNWRRSAAWAPF